MGKRMFLAVFSLSLTIGFSSVSEARRMPSSEATDLFEKVRDALKKSNLKQAQEMLEKENTKSPSGEVSDLVKFQLGYVQYLNEQYEKSASTFQTLLQAKTKLSDYAYFYLAQSYLKLGKDQQAEEYFRKIQNMSPNMKLRNDSELEFSILALKQKKFKEARLRLTALEKRARGTESYAEVIYNLALAERGMQNHAKSCTWAKKLYEKFPASPHVQDWGPDLAENKIENTKTDCHADLGSFKTRLKYLMWGGLDEKAQREINLVKNKLAKDSQYLADEMQAQFYLQEGEPHKALELLKPYYKTSKRNLNFLILYGSASARAGEVQTAVGTYYEAYKISPRSKQGRQALYQSAFLSYQFQDYDGAGRRFREFLKVYQRSGLARDAQWNLAWLQYLKGDFKGAYDSLSNLRNHRTSRRVKNTEDRIEYWRAMSLYRMGRVDQAKSIFESLSKDRLLGYYSIASQARLKKIAATQPSPVAAPMSENTRRISRFSWNEFLVASPVNDYDNYSSTSEETESEETVATSHIASDDNESEESTTDAVQEHGQSEIVANSNASDFKTPVLAEKFEKARDLMILGLDEWAKWDLFDIERNTRNKDYLRTLMNEYATVEHFHRSSYLGQVVFSSDRASQGIEGVRYVWEFAYPQAYSESVQKSAKEFKIPTELIWGIMRAESQYRRDAISPVGALGLMQVMPFTARKIASMLSEPNFKPTQLLDPPMAIRIGSRYLSRLMTSFDQNIPFVAASYNAGPHRVKTWLAYFGGLEMDEFIEHIPFLETRNYVKRVVSNSYVYSRLYGKEMSFNLSDPIKMKIDQSFVAKESWDEI
jgi:soluble lytic murein transglycosylase